MKVRMRKLLLSLTLSVALLGNTVAVPAGSINVASEEGIRTGEEQEQTGESMQEAKTVQAEEVAVDALEEVTGDAMESEIQLEEAQSLTLEGQSSMCYKFQPAQTDQYVLLTSLSEELENCSLYIYDENMQMLKWSAYLRQQGMKRTVTPELTAGATYYFYIFNSTENTCTFETVLLSQELGSDFPTLINGQSSGTLAMAANSTNYYFYRTVIEQADTFRLSNEAFVFEDGNSLNNNLSSLRIWDTKGNQIDIGNMRCTKGQPIYYEVTLQPGTYYVGVYKYTSTEVTMSYDLRLTSTIAGTTTPSSSNPSEFVEDKSEKVTLSPTTALGVDFYPEETQQYTLVLPLPEGHTVSTTSATQDWGVYLYDDNNKLMTLSLSYYCQGYQRLLTPQLEKDRRYRFVLQNSSDAEMVFDSVTVKSGLGDDLPEVEERMSGTMVPYTHAYDYMMYRLQVEEENTYRLTDISTDKTFKVMSIIGADGTRPKTTSGKDENGNTYYDAQLQTGSYLVGFFTYKATVDEVSYELTWTCLTDTPKPTPTDTPKPTPTPTPEYTQLPDDMISLAGTKTVTMPANSGIRYAFTPSTTGYYTFLTTAFDRKTEPQIERRIKDAIGNGPAWSFSEIVQGYRHQIIRLNAGTQYYFEIQNESDSQQTVAAIKVEQGAGFPTLQNYQASGKLIPCTQNREYVLYKTVITKKGTYRLTDMPSPSNGEILVNEKAMAIYTEDGTHMISETKWDSNGAPYGEAVLEPGTYYVGIMAQGGNIGKTIKYDFKLTSPALTYTIKYVLNGGKNNKNNPSSYSYQKVTLKNPTRKGYTFSGWYTSKTYKTKITTIAKGTEKNYTLYAKWKKVTVAKVSSKPTLKNVKTRRLKVTYKKVSGAKGYQICYSTSSKFKNAKYKTTTSRSKTLTKLKKNKTYYVKVRAYKKDSAGRKVYGIYSSVRKIKIDSGVKTPES